jgi:hypothetical protein
MTPASLAVVTSARGISPRDLAARSAARPLPDLAVSRGGRTGPADRGRAGQISERRLDDQREYSRPHMNEFFLRRSGLPLPVARFCLAGTVLSRWGSG